MAVDAPSPGADATAPPPAPPVPAPRRRSAIVVHPPAPTSLEATESTLPTFAMPDAYDSDDGAERLSRFRRNPAVLVGAGVTAGVLGAGLLAFNRGDSLWSQRLMRMRVVAQAATVGILIMSVQGSKWLEGDGAPASPPPPPVDAPSPGAST
ncbi:hypothetical protein I4F81_002426 [Pyropia yezoensis]|uniref:Uncharacterized protein n=1 Tax=Pyropia yezoensis TaxID=2788 RepID=A0ACC3BPN2_PYRYE|nr:hypothetical protein I4F81_002426 [Neopyropia yezoensis]